MSCRPCEQPDRRAHALPAFAAVAGLEQALLETARARRHDAAAVTRIDSKVNQRPRLLQLVPAPAAVAADQEPVVRGVVAIDALAGEAEHVEVGLARERDRLPGLARVC